MLDLTGETLTRPKALELALPENEPPLRELLRDENPDVGEAACRVLGLIGSEHSVQALLAYFHDGGSPDALNALLECGPAGRQALAQLCLQARDIAELAFETLRDGLRRPPYRGAILNAMRELVANPRAAQSIRLSAARNLALSFWKSAAVDLEQGTLPQTRPLAEMLSVLSHPPIFPPPQSAAQAIPDRYFANLKYQIDEQITAVGQRAREAEQEYHDELERRRSPRTDLAPKAGRNEPCPCGSGKKFKKCCLREGEALQRLDPWCQAHANWPWSPCGLVPNLPMERDNSGRLLAILSEQKPSRLRVRPDDDAGAAWVVASRLLELEDWNHALPAIRQALLEREPVDLDTDLILTSLVTGLASSKPPEYSELLLELFLRHGQECHLQLAGELLLNNPEEILSTLDGLVNRGLPLSKVMALVDGILNKVPFPELGEELAEMIPVFYSNDPTSQQALTELLERSESEDEEECPFPLPHPAVAPVLGIADFAAKCWLPDLTQQALSLLDLLRWPLALTQASPDSQPAIAAELETRRAQQVEIANQLRHSAQEMQAQSLEHLVSGQGPLLCLAPKQVLWFVPYSTSTEAAIQNAAAARTLAAALGWGRVSVVGLPNGAALCWAEAGTEDLIALAAEAADQWQLEGPGVVTFPCGCPENTEVLDWSEPHPLLEKARQRGIHLLEVQAEEADLLRSGPVPVHPTREVPAAPIASTGLESDPLPGRKALRRVLRRLFRTNKVGEAHTAVELVSRGVRGHLRGQVNQCIELLLQRGVLRNKPTLKGLHTSIEPKFLPAITRFIEEGTPPLPELENLLRDT